MAEFIDVECKYCGSVVELSKAVKVDLESGKFEYICDNCALKFKKKEGSSKIDKPNQIEENATLGED